MQPHKEVAYQIYKGNIMSLAPLLAAPVVVQIHALAALVSLCLGPVAIYRRKRDRLHKIMGYVWVLAMLFTAVSSFWINDIRLMGPFSPIHLLSIITLVSLARGVAYAIQRRIVAHRKTMQTLYFMSVWSAGIFTLLPNRIMGKVVFGEPSFQSFGITFFCIAIAGGLLYFGQKRGLIRV